MEHEDEVRHLDSFCLAHIHRVYHVADIRSRGGPAQLGQSCLELRTRYLACGWICVEGYMDEQLVSFE